MKKLLAGISIAYLAIGCASTDIEKMISQLEGIENAEEEIISLIADSEELKGFSVSVEDLLRGYQHWKEIEAGHVSAVTNLTEMAIAEELFEILKKQTGSLDGDAISWSMFKVMLNPDAWAQWLPLLGKFDIDLDWLPDTPIDVPVGPSNTGEVQSVYFLFDDASHICLNDLGTVNVSRDAFKASVKRQKDAGANSVWWFLSNSARNSGTGRGAPVSFYANNRIWGPVDQAKLKEMHWRCQYARAQGLDIMFWMFSDKSSDNSRTSIANQTAYLQKAVEEFGKYATLGYCLVLEADEHMSKDRVASLAKVMDGLTDKMIWIHQLPGRTSFITIDGIDGMMYQFGWGKSEAEMASITKSRIREVAPKKFAASEYNRSSDTHKARSQGSAAFKAGNEEIPTGNGRF